MDDAKRCERLGKLSEKKLLIFFRHYAAESQKILAKQQNSRLETDQIAVNQKLIFFLYKIMAVQEMETTNHETKLFYFRGFNPFIEEITSNVLDVPFFYRGSMVPSHLQKPRSWSYNNPQSLHETVRHDFNVGAQVAIPRPQNCWPYCLYKYHKQRTLFGNVSHLHRSDDKEINFSWFQGAVLLHPHLI